MTGGPQAGGGSAARRRNWRYDSVPARRRTAADLAEAGGEAGDRRRLLLQPSLQGGDLGLLRRQRRAPALARAVLLLDLGEQAVLGKQLHQAVARRQHVGDVLLEAQRRGDLARKDVIGGAGAVEADAVD